MHDAERTPAAAERSRKIALEQPKNSTLREPVVDNGGVISSSTTPMPLPYQLTQNGFHVLAACLQRVPVLRKDIRRSKPCSVNYSMVTVDIRVVVASRRGSSVSGLALSCAIAIVLNCVSSHAPAVRG